MREPQTRQFLNQICVHKSNTDSRGKTKQTHRESEFCVCPLYALLVITNPATQPFS